MYLFNTTTARHNPNIIQSIIQNVQIKYKLKDKELKIKKTVGNGVFKLQAGRRGREEALPSFSPASVLT